MNINSDPSFSSFEIKSENQVRRGKNDRKKSEKSTSEAEELNRSK